MRPSGIRSATRDAIKEIEIFLQRFPNSQLMPEARKMERQAKDRLSDANYRVGYYLLPDQVVHGRDRSLQGRAEERPGIQQPRRALFPPGRIALPDEQEQPAGQVTKETASEALPYYERLVKEFEKSEYLAAAQKRIAELKNPS